MSALYYQLYIGNYTNVTNKMYYIPIYYIEQASNQLTVLCSSCKLGATVCAPLRLLSTSCLPFRDMLVVF